MIDYGPPRKTNKIDLLNMNKKVSHTNLWLDPLVYLRETCPTWETPIPKAETKKNEKTRELDSNSSKDMMCLVTLQSVHQKIKVI